MKQIMPVLAAAGVCALFALATLPFQSDRQAFKPAPDAPQTLVITLTRADTTACVYEVSRGLAEDVARLRELTIEICEPGNTGPYKVETKP